MQTSLLIQSKKLRSLGYHGKLNYRILLWHKDYRLPPNTTPGRCVRTSFFLSKVKKWFELEHSATLTQRPGAVFEVGVVFAVVHVFELHIVQKQNKANKEAANNLHIFYSNGKNILWSTMAKTY